MCIGDMEDLERKILLVWILEGLLVSLILGIISVVGLVYIGRSVFFGFGFFVVLLFLVSVYMVKRYQSWGFELRGDYFYLEHGVFKKVKTMVPYVRLQHVDTQRNVVERLFGLSKIVVYTAGSRGADVTVPGLDLVDSEKIQEKLRDLAIESEDKDAV